MNKNLQIILDIETIKKAQSPVIEVKFNNIEIKDIQFEGKEKKFYAKFQVPESKEITTSVLEIKNLHENYMMLKDFQINNYNCLSFFTKISMQQENYFILKPDEQLGLRWKSPYSYFFLKNF